MSWVRSESDEDRASLKPTLCLSDVIENGSHPEVGSEAERAASSSDTSVAVGGSVFDVKNDA